MRLLALVSMVGVAACYAHVDYATPPSGASSLSGSDADTAIDVIVYGIASSVGVIEISLSNSAEQWQGAVPPLQTVRLPARQGVLKWTFYQVPEGGYAISVYHDQNNDETLDTNWRGRPIEPYGGSGGCTLLKDSNTFSVCRFQHQRARQTIEIGLVIPETNGWFSVF